MTHTPGPWAVSICDKELWDTDTTTDIESAHGEHIATMGAAHDYATWEADARLIAAAPDLLAACEAALAYIPGSEVHSWPPGFELRRKAIDLLRAAIAKAEGRS